MGGGGERRGAESVFLPRGLVSNHGILPAFFTRVYLESI